MPENCAAIVIAAKHHELTKVKDVRGTTETIGALRCKFQFRTDDWLHSAKTAMFCNGDAILHPEVIDDAIAVPLDSDNECPVPYEVLKDAQPYSIGVWGVTDNGLRIVSNWLVFRTQIGSYTEGNAPAEPERTVYEEILLMTKGAADAAQDITDRANDGEFDGKSAYELAQEEGFEGTLKEWMDSLVGAPGKDGATPVKGVDYYTEAEKQALSDVLLEMLKNTMKAAKIGEVTLLADAWVGEGNLYSQVVDIEGVTENSQVDLTPDVHQLAVFYNKDLTFVTENDGGVVTVYAIGQKPANDYTIQVTITEVDV